MGGRSFAIVCAVGALAVAGCADHGDYTVRWTFAGGGTDADPHVGCGMHGVDRIHVVGRSSGGEGDSATALCTDGQLSHSVPVGTWTLLVHQVDVRGVEVDPTDPQGQSAAPMPMVVVNKDVASDPVPVELIPRAVCSDGIDNDGDGRVDLDDPDCAGDPNGAAESPPP